MHTNHPFYGPVLPDAGWVPAPTYVLRRDRVLTHLRELSPPSRVVEIGCGAGALLSELGARGHSVTAVETGERARQIARALLDGLPDAEVRSAHDDAWRACFDAVLAFEVLEHIEDDRAAFAAWASWLAPGGRLVLSVPAHQRKWNPTDEWAGHYRRYESHQLRALARDAGLEVLALESYGFPLTPLLEKIRARTWQRGTKASREEGTAESGVDRENESRLFPLQASAPGLLLMRSLCRVQRAFLDTELSNGFILVARRPPDGR